MSKYKYKIKSYPYTLEIPRGRRMMYHAALKVVPTEIYLVENWLILNKISKNTWVLSIKTMISLVEKEGAVPQFYIQSKFSTVNKWTEVAW